MAPFNQRQIGYIQAIAGRQQHTTLRANAVNGTISSADNFSNVVETPQALDRTRVICGDLYKTPDASTNKQDDAHALSNQYNQVMAPDAKSLLLHTWDLDDSELGFDSLDKRSNGRFEFEDFKELQKVSAGNGKTDALNVFDAEVNGTLRKSDLTAQTLTQGEIMRNPEFIKSIYRATPDGFLNSTHLKFRFTLPGRTLNTDINSGLSDNTNPMGQDHFEFRWIVWRSKRPTMHPSQSASDTHHTNVDAIRDGCSFRNYAYDFFMGQTGRKRGMLGYTLNPSLDQCKEVNTSPAEAYSGYRSTGSALTNSTNVTYSDIVPDNDSTWTVDDLMTIPINRDDYVVMKDTRFFLGKEHGKSHFEDTLHWDWNDPIDCPNENVLASPTLNDKNYRWHMTLLGTSGGHGPCSLNYSLRWTTKMESG